MSKLKYIGRNKMKQDAIKSHDGIELHYAVTDIKEDKPWIALIFPFGLKLDLAIPFLQFFEPQYNVVVWETRSILEDSTREVGKEEFSIENHLSDMKTILDLFPSEKYIVVGYCSGAGIALGAANRYPNLIDDLLLVHGEYTMLKLEECTTNFAREIDSLLSMAGKDESYLQSVFDKIKQERLEETSNRPDGIDMPFTRLEFLRRHSANYLSYKANDFEHLAQWVPHKTLLMSGELDAQANVESTKRIASLIPNAEVYIDPDADHYGLLREDSNTLITIWNYLYGQQANAA
ncbi:alpha/beta fold hydrolase [Microbulbifer discodermiae]|uniref:alpha/beta fold hydrolase n=1 Tax=Microbulbifer sp. 2201CG32-9 TaxID=3232309 RepID=UPI00345B9E4F